MIQTNVTCCRPQEINWNNHRKFQWIHKSDIAIQYNTLSPRSFQAMLQDGFCSFHPITMVRLRTGRSQCSLKGKPHKSMAQQHWCSRLFTSFVASTETGIPKIKTNQTCESISNPSGREAVRHSTKVFLTHFSPSSGGCFLRLRGDLKWQLSFWNCSSGSLTHAGNTSIIIL